MFSSLKENIVEDKDLSIGMGKQKLSWNIIIQFNSKWLVYYLMQSLTTWPEHLLLFPQRINLYEEWSARCH